jgi:sugar lactone lactonase YvrE
MKTAYSVVSALRLAVLRVTMLALLVDAAVFAQSAPPVFQWTTIAGRAGIGLEDGPAASARFFCLTGLAFDPAGNLYIADTNNHTIRRISATGVVSTVAGSPEQPGSADGIGAAARFRDPEGVAVDAAGNVYVADTRNYTIRKVSPVGVVTTLAGLAGQKVTADGVGTSALFFYPEAVAVDGVGNVYVGDSGVRTGEYRLRRISAETVQTIFTSGTVTLADGSRSTVTLNRPELAVDANRQIYFRGQVQSDQPPWAPPVIGLFKIDAGGAVAVVLDPADWHYSFDSPTQRATDSAGNLLAIAYLPGLGPARGQVLRITAGGMCMHLGEIHNATGSDCGAAGLAAGPAGEVFYTPNDNVIAKMAADGTQAVLAGTPTSTVHFDSLAVDSRGSIWTGGTEGRFMGGRPLSGVALLKVAPNGMVTSPLETSLT